MVGMIALDSTPILCVIIIQVVNKDLAIKIGICITANPEGGQRLETPISVHTQE